MAGHDQTESSVTFVRNPRSRWSGIRNATVEGSNPLPGTIDPFPLRKARVKNLIAAVVLSCLCATPSLAAEPQGVLKKIKTTKTIALGYSESAVPFSFVGNDDRPQG